MMKSVQNFAVMAILGGSLFAAPALAQQTDDNPIVTIESPVDVAEATDNSIEKTQAKASSSDFNKDFVQGLRENLAKIYYDYAKAKPLGERTELLTLAAKNGHAPAQYELGLEKFSSARPPGNSEAAIRWLELAAKQGHDKAQQKLKQTRTIVARQKQMLNQKQVALAQRNQKPSCAETLQSGYFICTGESNSYACAGYGCEYHWECRREKRISKGNGHVRVVKIKDDSRYGRCRVPSRGPGGENASYCDPSTGTTDDSFTDLFKKVCR